MRKGRTLQLLLSALAEQFLVFLKLRQLSAQMTANDGKPTQSTVARR